MMGATTKYPVWSGWLSLGLLTPAKNVVNRGKIRYGGWHRTLCDKHAEKSGYDIDENERREEMKSSGLEE